MSKISFSKLKKGLDKASDKFKKILPNDSEDLKKLLEKLIDSVNKEPSSTEIEGHTGKVGDLKVVKKSKDKYDFYIKGEDGWHKDMNSSFEAIDKGPLQPAQQISIQQSDDGTISHKFNGVTKFTIDLDAGTVTGVATPTLKANGNLKLQPTGTTTVDSTLAVNTIAAADSDTDKFLVSDSGTVKYRTGTQLLSDIGAGTGSGDITGVSITTDSGSGSKAEDTSGSADFSLLGSNGVGITNSGTTITAVAVPAEIDHDSLNNFASNEHYTQANIIATGALDSGSITSGFGNINIGSSTIDTTGNVSVGDLQVNGNDIAFDAAASTLGVDASAHDAAGQTLTISSGSTTAGTSNDQAGGLLHLKGGQGKGSGAGGGIRFSVADGGSSGSSLNSYAVAMQIGDDKIATLNGDLVVDGGDLHVKGGSGASAELFITADDGEDNADEWKILVSDFSGGNTLNLSNKISGSHVNHFSITPNATVASSSAAFSGSLAINGTSGITAGAVVWQSFPFILSSAVNSRYYSIDVDDTANSYRRWDSYDSDPTGFDYRGVAGQFVVPEDCTLVAMHGVIVNNSSTNNPTVTIYHGTVTEAASDTTLASAVSTEVTITTMRVPYKFNATCAVNLDAGDIVVPTIYHADTGGTRNFIGNLTLKFITR